MIKVADLQIANLLMEAMPECGRFPGASLELGIWNLELFQLVAICTFLGQTLANEQTVLYHDRN
jgi:hypothetical protein